MAGHNKKPTREQYHQRIDPSLWQEMQRGGFSKADIHPMDDKQFARPYTLAAKAARIPELLVNGLPDWGMTSTNLRSKNTNVFYDKNAPQSIAGQVRGHEMEHVLSQQAKRSPAKELRRLNPNFNPLDFLQRLNDPEVREHLKTKWNMPVDDIGYFDSEQTKGLPVDLLVTEHLANLAGLESTQYRRLVDDPVIQKKLFPTQLDRDAYEAVTGLRQTRLDSKDLAPYTLQERPLETPKSETGDKILDWMIDTGKKLFKK